MRFFIIKITIITLLLLNFGFGEVLTLDDCIQLAITQNPQVLGGQHEMSAAKAQRYQSFAALFPSASITGSYTRLDEAPYTVLDPSAFPFPMPNAEPVRIEMGKAEMEKAELGITQPVSLQLFTALSLANIGVEQKRISLQKTKLQTALNAEKSYYQFLQAKAFLKIAMASKKQIDAHIKDLQNMFDQGMIHKKDLLSAQVRGSEIELLILQAQNAVQLSKSALCLAIGYPQDKQIDIAESLAFAEYNFPLDSAIAWTQRNAMDAKLLDVGLDASKKQVTLALEGLLPSFAGMFYYDYEKPNRQLENDWYDHWTAVGAIQWNVFDWGRNIAAVKQANEQKKQMQFLRQSALEGIALQTRAAYLAMDEKRKKLDVARKELETAEENYRVTNDLFRAGAATNAELLDAHTDLTRAKLNQNQYLADYNTAKVELEYFTGQLETKIAKMSKKDE